MAVPALPYLPILPDHDVVTVPVTDAQHIGGHTVASTGERELLNGSVQGFPACGEHGLKMPATPFAATSTIKWGLCPLP